MYYSLNDRWLWLGAGLALIIAVKGVSYAIHDTVRLTRVKPAGKDEDEELQRQPEDSIPLDVLRTLATSPNPNISKSAIDLISARCVKNSSLVSSVQSDAASSDPELRRKARTAMHFLSSYTLGGDTSNPIPPGMRTGGSTGALNLSPSVLSLDNGFEFDMGALSSYRPELDSGAVWSTVLRDRHEPDVRRRHREAMVLQGGTEMLDDEDVLRPRTT